MEMKSSGQTHAPPPADPPPYTPSQPSYGPTVVQPAPTTVFHPGTTTVIHGPGVMTVRQPGVSAVVVTNQMSPKPTVFVCPSCNHQIVTRVEYKSSTRTHLSALIICILCWPFVWFPYCMDICKNADHYCTNCNAYIGSYKG